MKNDKETKEKLLVSAKAEFLEKGYMQASLRNICKNAGVTTGALYFFFKDKEDVFASLVEEPLLGLHKMMKEHYWDEMQLAERGGIQLHDMTDDLAAAKAIIHYMYQHYDAFRLLLRKSQGSRFENVIDEFVTITEKHYRILTDAFSKQTGSEPIEDYMLHWISHMCIDAFVHMLTHEVSEEEALQCMERIVQYMIAGWMGMFQIKK